MPTKPIGYISPNVLEFLSGGSYRQGTICNYESDGEIPLYATTPPTNEALAAELLAPLAEAIERAEKARNEALEEAAQAAELYALSHDGDDEDSMFYTINANAIAAIIRELKEKAGD